MASRLARLESNNHRYNLNADNHFDVINIIFP